MADQQGEAPKIVIDSDWKAQAQKEREKLAEKERQAKAAAPAPASPTEGGPGAAGGQPGQQGMPQADFQALVGTMVTQCLMYMGAFPDPETGRAIVSLEHARFYIDLLGVLEQKTKGNLTQEETQDVGQALNELRIRFVELVQAIAQMQKEGKLKPTAGGAGGGGPGIATPGTAGRIGP